MMNKSTYNKRTIYISMMFALLFLGQAHYNRANAQNGVNSPYSRYGFGIQSDRATGFNKGMAGVAQGFRDGQNINVQNPASYSAVDSLTALFDFGLTLQNGNYKMGNLQQNAKNASIDYAAFHFRATKHVGVAVGILPYTNIGYSFSTSNSKVEGNEDVTSAYTFTGDGGLHQVFIGAGWQPFKPISIGANLSYLYGDYTHTMTNTFSESAIASNIKGYNANINTYMAELGIQYIQPINKNDKLTLGVTYGLGHDINNQAIRYVETFNNASATIEGITGDTLKNAFQLPQTFAVGLTYAHTYKWLVGADFELQKWSKCKFPADASDGTYQSLSGSLNDKMRIAIGATYTPNLQSRHYFDIVSYKFGAYYSQPYASSAINATSISKPKEFGITAGVTLPISNKWTWNSYPRINISVQWVHTDIPYLSNFNSSKQTLKENYLRLNIGLTVSDRWFHKYKVD